MTLTDKLLKRLRMVYYLIIFGEFRKTCSIESEPCVKCENEKIRSYYVLDFCNKEHLIKICYKCGWMTNDGIVILPEILDTPEFKWIARVIKNKEVDTN